MSSWQNKLLRRFFRLRRRRNRNKYDFDRARAGLDRLAGLLRVPASWHCQPVNAGGVPAEWITPPLAVAGRTLMYLHGGGYAVGSINSHRVLAGTLAQAAQARALLVSYRLAPENPFPAALQDAQAAYRWLLAGDPGAGGVRPHELVLGGDSAGGGLALATLVALRDAGVPLPAGAVCLSPWTDLAGTGLSLVSRAAEDPWLDPARVVEAARYYLPEGDLRSPLVSPLYADLRGLPPLLILAGDYEILLDDSKRLARRAAAAGVEVTLEVGEEMLHAWPAFAQFLPEARPAVALIGEWIRQRVGVYGVGD